MLRRHIWIVAAVGAAAVLLAGCGSGQDSAQRLATYLRRVNAVEKQISGPLATVAHTSAEIGRVKSSHGAAAGRQTRAQVTALLSAERRIRAVRGRLAALPSPAAARVLRALLLRLAAGQARVTDQTAKLVAYLPALTADVRPLSPALLTLERTLAINQAYGAGAVQAVYARKAAALRSFAGEIGRIRRRLGGLHPPQVSLPDYQAQLRSLSGMSGTAERLATVLASGQTSGIGRLLTEFDRAATANGTVTVQKAQAAAVKAYDRQVQQLSVLIAQADAERQRLAQTL